MNNTISILGLLVLSAACGSTRSNTSQTSELTGEPGQLVMTCENQDTGSSFRVRTLPPGNDRDLLVPKAGYFTSKNWDLDEPFACLTDQKSERVLVTTCQHGTTRVVITTDQSGKFGTATVSNTSRKLDPYLRHLLAETLNVCK